MTAGRLRAALRDTRPSPKLWLCGSALWGLAMAASAAFELLSRGWGTSLMAPVCLIAGASGVLAFGPALWLARLVGGVSASRNVAALLLAIPLATLGFAALFFALHYRSYYAQWHEPAFTRGWTLQLVFTMLTACYHFAVMGLRLFVPVGLVALLCAAWLSRVERPARL